MRTSHHPVERRLQALLLVVMLLLTSLPVAGAEDTTIYGCVTADQVRLRQNASKTASYWEYLPKGWVMTILGTTTASGTLWYHVQGNLPSALNSTYVGYIQGDFFRPLTMDETAAWLYNPTQGTIAGQPLNADNEEADVEPEPAPVLVSAGGWMMTTTSGVNLRTAPEAGADSLAVLPTGAMLAVNGYVSGWYYVGYGELYGYVSTSFVRAPSADELNAYLNGVPYEPEQEEEPIANAASVQARGSTAVVYTENGETVSMRELPYRTATVLRYLPNGTEVTVTETSGDWSLVIVDLTAGYVLSEYLLPVAVTPDEPDAAYGSANAVIRSNFMAKVNVGSGTLPLLKSASATSDHVKSIPNQGLLYIIEAGSIWSKTIYAGQTGYVETALLNFSNYGTDPAPYVIVTSQKRVNIRKNARTNAGVIDHVTHDEILPLWASPWTTDGYTWYPVTVGKINAYIRGDTCRLMTQAEYNAAISGGEPAPAPTATPGPAMSTVFESLSRALNVRAAATTSSKSLGKLTMKQRMNFTGTTTVNGELWYKVVYNGTNAFVMGKFVRVLTQEEAGGAGKTTPTPAPTVTPAIIPSGLSEIAYTVKNNIYVRKENTMKSSSLTKIRQGGSYMVWTGEVLADKNGENYTWYHIEYQDLKGWIRGDLIHVMTQAEWQETFGTPTPTLPPVVTPVPTPVPTATPRPGSADLTDVAYTVKNNIFVRKENTMKSTSLTKIYTAHTYVTVLGDILADKNGENYIWYHIRYNNRVGWIRGDLIHVMTNAEWQEEFGPQTTPTPVPTATPTPPPGGGDEPLGPYVAYESLRYGSTGSAVTRLQQVLFEQGYLDAASVTGTYTDATRKAVRTFQADQGLTVDGVAGQLTQAALFRTVAYDTTLYPVEKVTWADANKIWARGTVAVITDVYTGLSFAAKRYAGGLHADVEPLTSADTAIMCQIYGVNESQEIAEKNLYQRRPLWVTISGRSLAGSMYGVPHNPEGDTLPDNDYTGQFCVHFVGSKVHKTQTVDDAHQQAINYAYNNAPIKK